MHTADYNYQGRKMSKIINVAITEEFLFMIFVVILFHGIKVYIKTWLCLHSALSVEAARRARLQKAEYSRDYKLAIEQRNIDLTRLYSSPMIPCNRNSTFNFVASHVMGLVFTV